MRVGLPRLGSAPRHRRVGSRLARHLADAGESERESLRGLLRIGLHRDVEVTDAPGAVRPRVTQAFCSALPVTYTRIAQPHWVPFAQLVLDAAYEATLLAAVLNARHGGSHAVLLTCLGGGAYGNDARWIDAAIRRALERAIDSGLDVGIVSYGAPAADVLAIARDFQPRGGDTWPARVGRPHRRT